MVLKALFCAIWITCLWLWLLFLKSEIYREVWVRALFHTIVFCCPYSSYHYIEDVKWYVGKVVFLDHIFYLLVPSKSIVQDYIELLRFSTEFHWTTDRNQGGEGLERTLPWKENSLWFSVTYFNTPLFEIIIMTRDVYCKRMSMQLMFLLLAMVVVWFECFAMHVSE